ncbi:MAG: hypothetical protein V4747_11500 [Pseudomonadota bacterium]
MTTASLESIIRPFVVIESRPQVTVAPQPITDLEEIEAIILVWGRAANFIIPGSQLDRPIVQIINNPVVPGGSLSEDITQQLIDFENRINGLEDRDTPFEDTPFEYTEIGRTTETVRVYNPVEAEAVPVESERTQWVDVERIVTITFRSPTGEAWTFNLDHGGS